MIDKFEDNNIQQIKELSIAATQCYTTSLLYPTMPELSADEALVLASSSHEPIIPAEIGSGTFVIIDGYKGILTNDHVAEIFKQKNSGYIYIMGLNGNLIALKLRIIISLPADKRKADDTDIAFIAIDEEACKLVYQNGKNFFDLDQQIITWKEYAIFTEKKNVAWIIYGNVAEKVELIDDPNNKMRKLWIYPFAGPYFVLPGTEGNQIRECNYGSLKVKVDKIICRKNTKLEHMMPRSFEGMSGGALWKINFDVKFKASSITLVGIATEQGPYLNPEDQRKKANKIICRGPVTIYESFYPFCATRLKTEVF